MAVTGEGGSMLNCDRGEEGDMIVVMMLAKAKKEESEELS